MPGRDVVESYSSRAKEIDIRALPSTEERIPLTLPLRGRTISMYIGGGFERGLVLRPNLLERDFRGTLMSALVGIAV